MVSNLTNEEIDSPELLRVENKRLNDQLTKANAVIVKLTKVVEDIDTARRAEKIDVIVAKSAGEIGKDEIVKLSLKELESMEYSIDKLNSSTFAGVGHVPGKDEKPKKVLLTAGSWNPETKKWEGGL